MIPIVFKVPKLSKRPQVMHCTTTFIAVVGANYREMGLERRRHTVFGVCQVNSIQFEQNVEAPELSHCRFHHK